MNASSRITFTVALVAILGLGAAPARALAPAVEVSSTRAQLASPVPGHAREWAFTVTNTSGSAARVAFEVSDATGALLAGPHPAEVTFTIDGVPIVRGGHDIADSGSTSLGILAPGETVRVTGRLALPLEADDRYRDATASVEWRVSAQTADPAGTASSDGLAASGVALGAAAVGVPLVAAGLLLWFLAARRRRDGETEERA
ncbi:hypothetical protein [Homoserinibacter sp. GY 40078]|uniref:hypothetical protein n=1 Tax=Homoserinibacter sp. GY 40078 TaxID=2603275 RepID=UPI0011CB5499|nr:hypothetical protein [Homoserinibacter sp. GY 40078]TXK18539.1 hypothetical protein FVQ89_00855 [Homoserinibacter sp. GY 40078]